MALLLPWVLMLALADPSATAASPATDTGVVVQSESAKPPPAKAEPATTASPKAESPKTASPKTASPKTASPAAPQDDCRRPREGGGPATLTDCKPTTLDSRLRGNDEQKTAAGTIDAVPPAKIEPAKAEPAKAEPAKVEPAKVEPAKAEPAKVEPAKAQPAKAEPPKAGPPKPAPTATTTAPIGKSSAAQPPNPTTTSPATTPSAVPSPGPATVAPAVVSATHQVPEKRSMESLPKDLPPYAADRPLPALHIDQRRLGNGLQVWVVPRADGPPKVHFVLAVRGGLADDPPLQPGFSTLLAELLKMGTTARDAQTIAQDMQSCGGDLQVDAGVDGLTLSASALTANAAKAITLLSEVALNPSFPQAEIEQGKLRALQALLVAQADPDWQARRALAPLVFPGHPYGYVLPTRASLLGVTAEQLHAEHDRRFRPDEALLVVTGRIDTDTAMRLADAVFGDWSADGKPSVGVGPAPATAPPARMFVARGDSVQSVIRIGRPAVAATSPDYYPLLVTNAVLGEGFRSRLNLDLREDKGYTYGAGSALSAERSGGSLVAYTSVRNAVTGAAIGRILANYAQLGDAPVDGAELAQTRHYLVGSYMLRNQLQGEVADALAADWLAGLSAQALTDYAPKIEAVGAAQVRAMARKYFSPDDVSIVVVGDAGVLPQLRRFGDFRSTPSR